VYAIASTDHWKVFKMPIGVDIALNVRSVCFVVPLMLDMHLCVLFIIRTEIQAYLRVRLVYGRIMTRIEMEVGFTDGWLNLLHTLIKYTK
jgi:hypothetical protein